MNSKTTIGISAGDLNGIGLEVVIKTLSDARIVERFTPLLYCSVKSVAFHRKSLNTLEIPFFNVKKVSEANLKKPNLLTCWEEDVKIEWGRETESSGKYAFLSLEAATSDLLAGNIDALVTAPINKAAMNSAGFAFPGHTEYLQSKAQAKDSLLFMVSEDLRMGVVTGHIPLALVSSTLSTPLILSKLRLMNHSLKQDFWIEKPKIAVLALNPHAGDGGLLGSEEQQIIEPAILTAFEEGIMAFGPFPADGFFASASYQKYDAVMAMYHDQGLIPFKQLSFGKGVNFTAGLPFIRTSPDHGVGYDIAGKNLANEGSFREALYLAADLVKNRKEQLLLKSNPLKINKLSRDRD